MSSIQQAQENRGILVIYTGGTIGSAPRDPEDPDSPQVVVSWNKLKNATPELRELEKRGCRIDCFEFERALDSCNVGPDDWVLMAQTIADHYEKYEGFVILHGTDTMVYSASALSFLLQNLGKPVVLTGAQRSALVDVRNDATQNFITAILIANPRFSRLPMVPEVTILFGGRLLRGARAVKNDTSGYTAYQSPNLEPLGEAGERIVINENLVRPEPDRGQRLHIRTRLEKNVMPVFIYPGIPTDLVERQLSSPKLRAVVVQSFGSGNIPTRPDLLEVFRKAREERSIILATVSQCRRGPVELGIYETSAELLEAGFVAASDITVEAAQCKLMTLLGEPDIGVEEVEEEYQVSKAGEQSISQFVTHLEDKPNKIERQSGDEKPGRLRLPGRPLVGQWNPQRLDRALLRLRHAQIISANEKQAIEFQIFVNLDPDEPANDDHPNLVGRIKKWPMAKSGLVVFDATKILRSIGKPGERISFTLIVDTPGGSISWGKAELALFIRETERK